jgi:ATP-binding cassette subfamily C protein CydD
VLVVDAERGETPLTDVDLASLWTQVAWVPQRPALQPGSLRDLVGGRGPDDPRVGRAAGRTGLDAVVAGLPDGWDTAVGRGGLGLSVGQRQRVALAAALVGDAALVVLDEPSAHLDARSEEDLVRTIAALRDDGRTVLVVAHRPALVRACDRAVEVRSVAGVVA